jgi:hypothetical protein
MQPALDLYACALVQSVSADAHDVPERKHEVDTLTFRSQGARSGTEALVLAGLSVWIAENSTVDVGPGSNVFYQVLSSVSLRDLKGRPGCLWRRHLVWSVVSSSDLLGIDCLAR